MSKIQETLDELNLGLDQAIVEKLVEAFEEAVNTAAEDKTAKLRASLNEAVEDLKKAKKDDDSDENEDEDEDDEDKEKLKESYALACELLAEAKSEILEWQTNAKTKIDEFLKEHSETLVENQKVLRLEGALNAVKAAFETHGFALNENYEFNRLEEASERLLAKFHETTQQLAESEEKIETLERTALFEQKTKDLTDTQKERAAELLEAVSFDSREEFETGLALILEKSLETVAPPAPTEPAPKSNEMSKYMDVLKMLGAAS